ncbi:unnamed protein product [Orchesella dallaii]|uniref:Odorant receptor n=1 Tax=Orchesella dallaii TaxID=48710 RepID=A0ABP1RJJ1_9HEXA
MASSLLLKCFSLHQSLTIPYFPHRISWSPVKKQWKYESNIPKLIPFYLFYSFSFVVIYSCSLLVICNALWLHPGLFHAEEILVSIFLLVSLLFTLVGELPLKLYGSEYIAAVNAYISLDIRLSPQPRNPQKASFVGEIRKLFRKEAVDEAGIILNILIATEVVTFFTLPLFLVHLNLDPIHLAITALFPEVYLKWSQLVQILVKVIRYLFMWLAFEIMGQSMRVVSVFPMGGLALMHRVFRKTLNQVELYHGAFQIFMQLHITFAIMNRGLKLSFTMYLFTACICFITSMVTNIKGYGILPPSFYWVSPLVTMIVIICLLFVFGVAGDLCSMSEQMLDTWKRQLATTSSSGLNRRVAKKSLRMCRRIAIPVGDIAKLKFALIVVHLDLDPIHLAITALFPEVYLKWSEFTQILVKVIRYFLMWLASEIMGQNMRVVIVFSMGGLALMQREYFAIDALVTAEELLN